MNRKPEASDGCVTHPPNHMHTLRGEREEEEEHGEREGGGGRKEKGQRLEDVLVSNDTFLFYVQVLTVEGLMGQ